MIDLWARINKPRTVFSDITKMGFVGDRVPEKYEKVFAVVAAARDAAIALIRERFSVAAMAEATAAVYAELLPGGARRATL